MNVMWAGIRVWIVATALLTLPGSHDPFILPKHFLLMIGLMALTFCNFRQVRDIKTPATWLGLYIGLFYMLYQFGGFIFQQQKFTFYNWMLPSTLLTLLSAITAKRILDSALDRDMLVVISGICIAVLLIAIHSILQRLGFNQWMPTDDTGASLMFSTLGNRMLVGNYMAMCAPLFLIFRRMQWGWALCGLVIFLTANRAGELAFIGSSLLLIALNNPRRIVRIAIAAVGLFAIIVLLFHWRSIDGGRLSMWQDTMNYFMANGKSITGYGLGFLEFTFRNPANLVASGSMFHHPHNEAISLLFSLGVIGASLAAWTLGLTAYRFVISKKSNYTNCLFCSLISTVIIGMFSFPLHIAPMALSALFIWVALEIAVYNRGVKYVSA